MSLPPKFKAGDHDAKSVDSIVADPNPSRASVPPPQRRAGTNPPAPTGVTGSQPSGSGKPVRVSGRRADAKSGGKTTPKGPPQAKPPKDLSQQFAANPFDANMREPGPGGGLVHTDLGLLVEIWHWYQTHMISCGTAFEPIANSLYDHLMRKCPQHIGDIKRIAGELSNQNKARHA